MLVVQTSARIMDKANLAFIMAAILICVMAVHAQENEQGEPEAEQKAEPEAPAAAGEEKSSVSLGKILGLAFLACCILYCIGISWKVYKVCKSTYVEEEPVFLKYK